MDTTGQVPHLLSTAQVQLTIGSQCVQHIQLALSQLMSGHSTEGIGDRIAAGTVSDPREVAIVGLSNLLATIYKVAQDTNQVVMRPLDISGLQ